MRSGSFGLGVLQGLARAGVLGKFDYLSTVSGGGYIGGWLTAWRLHARERGEADPCEQLATRCRARAADAPAPRDQVPRSANGTALRRRLDARRHDVPQPARQLDGADSAHRHGGDAARGSISGCWACRRSRSSSAAATLDWWYLHDWIPVVVLIAIATTYAAVQLPSLGHRAAGSRSFVIWFLAPVLLVLFLFSVAPLLGVAFRRRRVARHRAAGLGRGDGRCPGSSAVPSAIAGGVRGPGSPRQLPASRAACVASWAHHFLTALARHDPQVFVVIDLPTSLVLLFLQITVFIGLASRDMTDDDREWWARAGAWILIVGLSWLVGERRCDPRSAGARRRTRRTRVLPRRRTRRRRTVHAAVGRCSLPDDRGARIAGQTMALRDRAGAVPRRAGDDGAARRARLGRAIACCFSSFTTCSSFTSSRIRSARHCPRICWRSSACWPLGAGLGRVISINQFSLHGMYRSRLVRTFLGVSRPKDDRHPSAFTGFDAADDMPFDRVRDRRPSAARRQHAR